MKALAHALIFLVAAAIGIALGFAWRGQGEIIRNKRAAAAATATHPSPTSSQPFGSATSGLPRRSNSTGRQDDSPLATRLAQDLSMSSGVVRWLHWLDALERATAADFPRLAQLAEKNSHAMRLLAARWVEADPRSLFDHLMRAWQSGAGNSSVGTLASTLFQEWPKRDLDTMLSAMNATNSSAVPRNWRMQAAGRIFDVDVERGLKVFGDWNIQNYSPSPAPIRKWAEANPQHAADFALANPVGFATSTVMEAIGKEWAKIDPAQALRYSTARTGEAAQRLTSTVLKEWASQDLNAAAEWLGSVDPATRELLSAPFVEIWAKTDPQSALGWCEENLSGARLSKAVNGVFKGAAARDVVAAADLVSRMNPSAARGEAAAAVAQKWFPDPFTEKPIPPATVEWLQRLDGDTIKRVLEDRQWSWAQTDAKGLAAFVSRLGSDAVPSNTYSTIASRLARDNPAEAMTWASSLPEQVRASALMNAFIQWQGYNPTEAGDWLSALPSTDARREPLLRAYVQALAHDPNAAERLAHLSENDRKAAQKIIEKQDLSADRRATLLNAVK